MVRGVIQHAVFPAAEAQGPERPPQRAFADLARREKGIARREPPQAEGGQRAAPGDIRRHDREGQRDHQLAADRQVFRHEAGVGRQDRLLARAIAPREGVYRIPGAQGMHQIARVPGQQRAVRLRPRDAVGAQAAVSLKAPERRGGDAAEHAVDGQIPETGAVQGRLQQLYRGAAAAETQNSHVSPSFGTVYAPGRREMRVFSL